jgi:hypothetical protein
MLTAAYFDVQHILSLTVIVFFFFLFLFIFTPVGKPPKMRFVFATRSGDCEGCRIRSWDCYIGSLDSLLY